MMINKYPIISIPFCDLYLNDESGNLFLRNRLIKAIRETINTTHIKYSRKLVAVGFYNIQFFEFSKLSNIFLITSLN